MEMGSLLWTKENDFESRENNLDVKILRMKEPKNSSVVGRLSVFPNLTLFSLYFECVMIRQRTFLTVSFLLFLRDPEAD